MKISSIIKGALGISVILVLVIGAIGFNSVMEFVDNDEYVVHQSAFSGDLTVWNDAGWHPQWFGKVVAFKKAGDLYLSSDPLDGGKGADVQPIAVLFPDGSADVDVVARYELSLNEEIQKELYKKYGGETSVKSMIRQQVLEGMKQVGPLMSSSDAYSDRKSEVAILARSQALVGVYASDVSRDTTFDKEKNVVLVKSYDVKRDSLGIPVITKASILAEYAITLPVYNVKDMDFDDKTDALISARKEAQKAKQDAITAFQQGQARVASERATQEVEKIKQVTIAEKEKEVAVLNANRESEVAKLNAEKAKQEALATVRKAEAKKKELLLADGLSAKAKYEIDANKEARIESAKHYSKWVGPQIVVNGAGGKGGSGLGDVLMLERYQAMLSTK